MNSAQLQRLLEERARTHQAGLAITEAATTESRDLSGDEQGQVDQCLADLAKLDARIADAQRAIEGAAAADEARALIERAARPAASAASSAQDDEIRAYFAGDVRGFVARAVTKAANGDTMATEFVTKLYEGVKDVNIVRQIVGDSILTTTHGNDLHIPRVTAGTEAFLVGEGAIIPSSDPAFDGITLKAYKIGKLTNYTSEFEDDNVVNALNWLASDAGEAIGAAEEKYFLTGTGTNQPEGLVPAVTVGVNGEAVSYDSLVKLVHSVKEGYRANGRFLVNDATVMSLRLTKDSDGRPIWQPSTQAGVPSQLLGYAYHTTGHVAPSTDLSARAVLFGDVKRALAVRQVAGVSVKVSEDFAFDTDEKVQRVITRVDSRVRDANACKALVTPSV